MRARAPLPVEACRRPRRDARRGTRPMTLFQISEPEAAPTPHAHKRAIGIDLGTTNSLVATVRDGMAVVLPDAEGRPLLPSVVRYGDVATDVGYAALAHAPDDPHNTIASIK